MTEKTDYTPILADLERQRAEIDQAIAVLRRLAGMPPGEEYQAPNGTEPHGSPLRKDALFGMKAPDAIKTYLAAIKQPRSASKIAEGLLQHGFVTSSGNPANALRTSLRRMEKRGEVVKVKKEWGLAGWYPGIKSKKPLAKEGSNGPKNRTQRGKSAYHQFVAKKMKDGMTMKEVGVEWRKLKKTDEEG